MKLGLFIEETGRKLYLTCRHRQAGASKISVGVKRRKPSRRERRATAVSRAQRKGGEEGGGGGRRGKGRERVTDTSSSRVVLSVERATHMVKLRPRRPFSYRRDSIVATSAMVFSAREGEKKEARGREDETPRRREIRRNAGERKRGRQIISTSFILSSRLSLRDFEERTTLPDDGMSEEEERAKETKERLCFFSRLLC